MAARKTLTESDFAQITNIFRSELQPVKDDVLRHDITLFGPDKESGIVRQVESHENMKKKAGLLFAVTNLLAGAGGYWIPKIFGQK